MWLYRVFSWSLRDVELILAERGIVAATHESYSALVPEVRADFAGRQRQRRPKPRDIGHLDAVFIRIRGMLHYIWRAIHQHGVVLDILVSGPRERRR